MHRRLLLMLLFLRALDRDADHITPDFISLNYRLSLDFRLSIDFALSPIRPHNARPIGGNRKASSGSSRYAVERFL
jgi:hypothetical protein